MKILKWHDFVIDSLLFDICTFSVLDIRERQREMRHARDSTQSDISKLACRDLPVDLSVSTPWSSHQSFWEERRLTHHVNMLIFHYPFRKYIFHLKHHPLVITGGDCGSGDRAVIHQMFGWQLLAPIVRMLKCLQVSETQGGPGGPAPQVTLSMCEWVNEKQHFKVLYVQISLFFVS